LGPELIPVCRQSTRR